MTGIYLHAGGSEGYIAHPNGSQAAPFGRWTIGLSREGHSARLRSLRMAVLLLYRHRTNFVDALTLAEMDDEWLLRARDELDRMPALHRRRLLASYLNLWVRP